MEVSEDIISSSLNNWKKTNVVFELYLALDHDLTHIQGNMLYVWESYH
jgi:hypothetical protein